MISNRTKLTLCWLIALICCLAGCSASESEQGIEVVEEIRNDDAASAIAEPEPDTAASEQVAATSARLPKPDGVDTCFTCHGYRGKAPIAKTYPIIGGQNEPYLLTALKAYRAQERGGTLAATMSSIVVNYTDEELQAFAHYFSAQ